MICVAPKAGMAVQTGVTEARVSGRFESSPGNKFLYEYGKKRSRQKERDSKLDSHGTFNFCANHQSITAIKDIIEANNNKKKSNYGKSFNRTEEFDSREVA